MCEHCQRLGVAVAVVQEKLDAIDARLERIEAAVSPNGSGGLILQVDRLRETAKRQTWALRAIALVVLGGIAKWIAGQ
jgi:hypothetical protein